MVGMHSRRWDSYQVSDRSIIVVMNRNPPGDTPARRTRYHLAAEADDAAKAIVSLLAKKVDQDLEAQPHGNRSPESRRDCLAAHSPVDSLSY